VASGITGTGNLAASPTAYSGTNSQLTQAIQQIWSKEILFQAMPILRFEQFAVKKTELGVAPGLQINFMRYNNLGFASALVEGVRMQSAPLTAQQFSITVSEHGYALAVSELLLNASFDDVMASASRLLGRNMAIYLDQLSRDTLYGATSTIYGEDNLTKVDNSGAKSENINNWYANGYVATSRAAMNGANYLTPHTVKDAVETLSTKNIPRLGETYVAFVHPHQSRKLRDNPEFIEVTKYAAPGNFMLGEIGRLYDTVFIETTQVLKVPYGSGGSYSSDATVASPTITSGGGYITPTTKTGVTSGGSANTTGFDRYDAIFIGDNAFGHAISLPVELRDGGILDFGREHALAWYSIFGLGLITDQAVVIASTN
jgi:N4-gp56 family major capsid protein